MLRKLLKSDVSTLGLNCKFPITSASVGMKYLNMSKELLVEKEQPLTE